MEGNYEVKFGAQTVGKVQVLRQGLYYRFICRCMMNGDVVSRLIVNCDGKCENIGVLIPSDENFVLDKKIPAKIFGEGTPNFYLAPRHDTVNGKFIPIYPEEPFAYIARLKDAFLATKNGRPGAVLKPETEYDCGIL